MDEDDIEDDFTDSCYDGYFGCDDCGACTLREYYMVRDDIWKAAGGPRMLCVGCLEARIGRKLMRRDFPDCPLNSNWIRFSPRLRNRLTRLD